MQKIEHSVGGGLTPGAGNHTIERRILRTMALATVLAAFAALPFAQWRVSSGLLLGGGLSLLNHYWLNSSATAAFSVLVHGAKPRLGLLQYVLRYLVVTAIVLAAYKLNVVSLAATIIGLCSFVVALFWEALREFYFTIIHREEIS
ncbi:MAG TPA: ATP synthase subunit I [Pyrinomonadaceae bacterium]|nr:ATP synthase subunit I [Pyrinomonadaceae bacterium]